MAAGVLKRLTMAVMFGCAVVAFAPEAEAQGRLMPPESVRCDPNHLTSFTGRVLFYERRPGRVRLRVRTDEQTTENFTLRFGKNEDAAKWFLMFGGPFEPKHWKIIERRRYRLRPRMRATVWVCDDRSTPIVDWRPGLRNAGTVY